MCEANVDELKNNKSAARIVFISYCFVVRRTCPPKSMHSLSKKRALRITKTLISIALQIRASVIGFVSIYNPPLDGTDFVGVDRVGVDFAGEVVRDGAEGVDRLGVVTLVGADGFGVVRAGAVVRVGVVVRTGAGVLIGSGDVVLTGSGEVVLTGVGEVRSCTGSSLRSMYRGFSFGSSMGSGVNTRLLSI